LLVALFAIPLSSFATTESDQASIIAEIKTSQGKVAEAQAEKEAAQKTRDAMAAQHASNPNADTERKLQDADYAVMMADRKLSSANKAKARAEEKARKEAEAKLAAQKAAEEQARKEAEAKLAAQKAAEEKARKEAEAKLAAQKAAEEQARKEAEAKLAAQKAAEEQARKEAEAKLAAQKAAEAQAQKNADTKMVLRPLNSTAILTAHTELSVRNRSSYPMFFALWKNGANCTDKMVFAANFNINSPDAKILTVPAEKTIAVGVGVFDMKDNEPLICDYILSFKLVPATKYMLEYDVHDHRCFGQLYQQVDGVYQLILPGEKEELAERISGFGWDQVEPGCEVQ